MEDEARRLALPDLGDVDEVKVVEWFVAAGQTVRRGDELVEVETAKTTFVVPAPWDGRIRAILAGEGAIVRPGEALATVDPR
jgi:pyruvate dehydrogenase E2 component (dihydrolipoamide acetyltransferase)